MRVRERGMVEFGAPHHQEQGRWPGKGLRRGGYGRDVVDESPQHFSGDQDPRVRPVKDEQFAGVAAEPGRCRDGHGPEPQVSSPQITGLRFFRRARGWGRRRGSKQSPSVYLRAPFLLPLSDTRHESQYNCAGAIALL